ncbi:MAG: DMT family transporter [bacterium]|nr:DMT family transporter [bacterium]
MSNCQFYFVFFVHKKIDYPDLKNKWLWVYAFFGITLNISFFFAALERTTAINATIIASTGPVMVLIGSALFLREKFKINVSLGVIVALIGALVIIFQPILENGFNGALTGNLFMLLATLGAVIATIAGRKFLTPANALGSTFWTCLIGCLTFLPFMLWEYSQNPIWIADLDSRGFLGIIYGAVFSSTIAYAVYNWALAKLPAFKTSVFTYIDPVVAVLIAIPLLGEKITLPFIIGSTLIFLGILIAEKRLQYHPLHKLFKK